MTITTPSTHIEYSGSSIFACIKGREFFLKREYDQPRMWFANRREDGVFELWGLGLYFVTNRAPTQVGYVGLS